MKWKLKLVPGKDKTGLHSNDINLIRLCLRESLTHMPYASKHINKVQKLWSGCMSDACKEAAEAQRLKRESKP